MRPRRRKTTASVVTSLLLSPQTVSSARSPTTHDVSVSTSSSSRSSSSSFSASKSSTWRSRDTVSGGAGGAGEPSGPPGAGGGGRGGGGESARSVAFPVSGSIDTSACESRTCFVNSMSWV